MLKFRPHKRTDIPFRVKWLSDPEVTKYLGENRRGQKTTLKKEKAWFDMYVKMRNKKRKKFFTICDGKKPIGFMGLTKISRINRNSDMFIAIGEKDYWGRGWGKNSVIYLVNYAFKKLKLHKVNLGVFTDNKPAFFCYKSAGFKVEGILRDDAFAGGKYRDMYTIARINKKH